MAVSAAAGSAAASAHEPGGLARVVAQQRVFGAAAEYGEAEHLIADGRVVDAIADLVNHAERLLARDARKLDRNELRHRVRHECREKVIGRQSLDQDNALREMED